MIPIMIILFHIKFVVAQFKNDSLLCEWANIFLNTDTKWKHVYYNTDNQTMAENTAALKEKITSHPDVNILFHPQRALIGADSYVFNYPLSADYRIGLLVDPCRFNAYNCCMNVFGTPEYPILLQSGQEAERVLKYKVIADEDEVSSWLVLYWNEAMHA